MSSWSIRCAPPYASRVFTVKHRTFWVCVICAVSVVVTPLITKNW
jgi:hypothetical protein